MWTSECMGAICQVSLLYKKPSFDCPFIDAPTFSFNNQAHTASQTLIYTLVPLSTRPASPPSIPPFVRQAGRQWPHGWVGLM